MKIRYKLTITMLAVAGIVGLPALAAQNKGDKVAAPAADAAKPQLPGGASALSESMATGRSTARSPAPTRSAACRISSSTSRAASGCWRSN
ncbi:MULTISPECIES: hypothetical protein [unclassified Mesorhizobium]|uniref:hypothetical protein n=1 Tax=unclassified Mesorhizobium TaxID=325217 RepID=UPI001FDF316C|nr:MULTISPECIES: hypothetical protein [unclassified Mesorhizobium]